MPTNSEKKSSKKNIFLISLIILLIIITISLLVYYFWPPKKDSTSAKSKGKTPIAETKKLTVVNEDSNARPIAVMIDNNIGQGLHAGLQESYINYEIIVEGGLTRIMAIFKDKETTLIGPVRSSRHYFLDYALESDCIYAHYGWSPYAQNDIATLGVNNINGLYDDPPFWRDTTISAPHNVFTSIEKLYAFAASKNYSSTTSNWKLLNYNPYEVNLNKTTSSSTTETPENASDQTTENSSNQTPDLLTANNVSMTYSNYQTRSYVYDSTRKVYLRFMNDAPHIDKTTKEQLHYKNIIIQKVNNKTLDSYNRQDLDTVGTGEGYYITNGYSLPINWTKSSRSAKTKYTYKNGTEIEVNDGNTFIQIVPLTSNISISR